MGTCLSKKKNNQPISTSRDVKQPEVPQSPPQIQIIQHPDPLPELNFLFKVIPDTRKVYIYSIKHKSAFMLPVSIPFIFKKSCGVCSLGSDRFMIAGGIDSESEVSKEAMIFDINKHSGQQIDDLLNPCSSPNLIYYQEKKIVYLIGGLQSKLNDSNIEEFYDYKGSDFCCFNLETKKWSLLAPCIKQFCLPICYLKDKKIYVCGGFSSIQEETKFKRKTSVFIYNILRNNWTQADYDFPIAAIGSVALSVADKVLILGGMLELSNPSSKAFLLNDNQVANLRDFQIPNMAVLSPGYTTPNCLYFLAEPEMLLTYDIKTSTISHESLHSLHPPINEFFSNKIGNNPRNCGIYVYSAECVYKIIRDFNVISKECSSHNLKNIQYRDGGVLVMSDGKIFFAGGVGTSTSKSTNLCFFYDPLNEEEKETSSLPSPLRGLRLVESTGIIYAIAGFYEGSEKPQESLGYFYIINTHE